MPRVVKQLSDMEIDEISLVDRGANQHAAVSIAKRAPEEDHNMPDFYIEDENGELSLLDPEQATEGMTVFDESGNEYVLEAEAGEEVVEERELAEVGKSAFFRTQTPKAPVSKGATFADQVMADISKADTDDERDAVIRKAFGELAEQNERNAEIAKSERDLRLTREYIAKAAEYGTPGVTPEELGPVMFRMAETMSDADCAVIAKALEAGGAAAYDLFEEIGQQGGGSNSDVMDMVDGYADEFIAKQANGEVAKAEAIEGIFDANPGAYDAYLADQRARY